jgi:hypothetical protein
VFKPRTNRFGAGQRLCHSQAVLGLFVANLKCLRPGPLVSVLTLFPVLGTRPPARGEATTATPRCIKLCNKSAFQKRVPGTPTGRGRPWRSTPQLARRGSFSAVSSQRSYRGSRVSTGDGIPGLERRLGHFSRCVLSLALDAAAHAARKLFSRILATVISRQGSPRGRRPMRRPLVARAVRARSSATSTHASAPEARAAVPGGKNAE